MSTAERRAKIHLRLSVVIRVLEFLLKAEEKENIISKKISEVLDKQRQADAEEVAIRPDSRGWRKTCDLLAVEISEI